MRAGTLCPGPHRAFVLSNCRIHNRLAAIDAASGSVDNTWDPQANLPVRALAVSGGRVYLGGNFGSVDGEPRGRLALVDAATGELDPTWQPTANSSVTNSSVSTLAVSGDQTKVYVGGRQL